MTWMRTRVGGPWAALALWLCLSLIAACKGPDNTPPQLANMRPQLAFVGSELSLPLLARDQDGDRLRFGFDSNVPDLCRGNLCRARLNDYGRGRAVFRWRPLPTDLGSWNFTFKVTDGINVTKKAVPIEVRSSVGYNGSPIFIQPLGTGTTLDIDQRPCVRFDVVVDDPDSAEVRIAEEPPYLEGSMLEPVDAFAAIWSWCPDETQLQTDSLFNVTLSADDGSSPKTIKNFLIVVQRPPKAGCRGGAPQIDLYANDYVGHGFVPITADVSDDIGLKHPPVVFYSSIDPGETPNLGAMVQSVMRLSSGSMRNGRWQSSLPNPALGLPPGTAAELFFVVVAQDNDDPSSGCDHRSQAPKSGAQRIAVSTPKPEDPPPPTSKPCELCTQDIECGAAADLCARVGDSGEAFCLQSCEATCPEDFTCTDAPIESVDGAMAPQCVPIAGRCGSDPADDSCADDSWEENDSLEVASAADSLAPGRHEELVSCNDGQFNDDEDWYRVEVSEGGTLGARVEGEEITDLDLALFSADGARLAQSNGLSSQEELFECVLPGSYYLRVSAYGTKRNPYSLQWGTMNMSCEVGCVPDAFEPDDDPSSARPVDVAAAETVFQDNSICGGNDDWFALAVEAGSTIVVDLHFEQNDIDEDLDLHVIDPSGVDLTPCDAGMPESCSEEAGQSGDAGEHLEWLVETSGTHHIVVTGFDHSENRYDIRLQVKP